MTETKLVELVEHETSYEAAEVVAEEAAAWLGICLIDGAASVALPGGRSPEAMLRLLAQHPIGWNRITVTTTDERAGPEAHALSNMGSVRRAFAGEHGQNAKFVPLKDRYAHCLIKLPFDLLILGIGADGHIASLFPGSHWGSSTDLPVIDVTPDPLPIEAPVARLSWSLPVLSASRRALIFCAGPDKRAAVDAALQSSTSPLGAFLVQARGPVSIHWAERTVSLP